MLKHCRTVFVAVFFLFLILPVALVHAEEVTHYTCPMHPHYITDEMGTCPICGMDLVAVVHEEDVTSSSQSNVSDVVRSSVLISPEMIQTIGVRTENASMTTFGNAVRSYGIVTPNERLQKRIYSRVEGWISGLGVSAVGDVVAQGDHIYTIHSPDLMLAQQDVLSLEKNGRNIDLSKLFLHYEVDKSFVDELRRTKKVTETVPYTSPYAGTVSELNVRPGSYVTLDMPLMVLEDYSSVWITASIAEQDLRFLSRDSSATVTFPNLGGVERVAQVDYIYPTIDAATRTGQVRLVLDNKDGMLKPGAYADVVFETQQRERLSVPSEAILRSSEGDFIVVALGDGRFQPRKILTGIHNKGRTEVLSGLKSGEDVVVSSQFLIDSESSLREAFRKMGGAESKVNAGGETHVHHQ